MNRIEKVIDRNASMGMKAEHSNRAPTLVRIPAAKTQAGP
jgi:hypothetical protein